MIGYATKRLRGPAGMLISSRSVRPHASSWASWLQLPPGRDFGRIVMQPLSLGGVHRVLTEHLGRTLPRPVIARIHEISGGNPLFALKLARALDTDGPDGLRHLPPALDKLLERHVDIAHPGGPQMLLALACLTESTASDLALATDIAADEMSALLDEAESRDIVSVDGNRVRFAHPLLGNAVYSSATTAQAPVRSSRD